MQNPTNMQIFYIIPTYVSPTYVSPTYVSPT